MHVLTDMLAFTFQSFPYTILVHSSINIICTYILLEVIMNPAFDSMCLQSEIDISYTTVVHVVLVQYIIQALIEVLQVKKDDCSACLHTDLYLVDVSTDLHVITFRENILGHCNSFLYVIPGSKQTVYNLYVIITATCVNKNSSHISASFKPLY